MYTYIRTLNMHELIFSSLSIECTWLAALFQVIPYDAQMMRHMQLNHVSQLNRRLVRCATTGNNRMSGKFVVDPLTLLWILFDANVFVWNRFICSTFTYGWHCQPRCAYTTRLPKSIRVQFILISFNSRQGTTVGLPEIEKKLYHRQIHCGDHCGVAQRAESGLNDTVARQSCVWCFWSRLVGYSFLCHPNSFHVLIFQVEDYTINSVASGPDSVVENL